MIVDRLVYGCARLTGGASAAASRRLIEACLAAGVRHFDTAPSYGLGTAERLLGAALAGRTDVRLTVKVGSARPRLESVLTGVRALKGAMRGRASPMRDDFSPSASAGAMTGPGFTPAAMARSVEISQQALRRDRFDALLLHEVDPRDLDEERIAFLRDMRARDVAAAVGWSTGAVADRSMTAGSPGDLIGQAAVAPHLFQRPSAQAPAYLHSIANTLMFRQRTDHDFAHWLTVAGALIPDSVADRRTAMIAVGFARLRAVSPPRGLIFASIDPARLARFLAAVQHLDRHVGPDPFTTPIA